MYKLAYLLPVAAMLVFYQFTGNTEYWWLYIIMVVAAEVILYLLTHWVAKVKEYLSGYVVAVEHHFAWVERQVYTTTVYLNGRAHTETRHRFVKHPDQWFQILNTGLSMSVHSGTFTALSSRWGTAPYGISPYHINCVSGGGGQRYDWNSVEDDTITVTYTGRYSNPVRYSNSIFNYKKVSDKTAQELGLIPYPKIKDCHQNVICSSSKLIGQNTIDDTLQDAFRRINAFCGSSSQIHVFVLLFDASQGIGIVEQQRAYWKGGNKNEFTVCLGMSGNTVSWCLPFSWMDAPTLAVATQSYFTEHPELNLTEFAAWLRQNISLWKRKEFKDFKYLGTNLSKGQTVAFYALAVAISAIAIAIASWASGQ